MLFNVEQCNVMHICYNNCCAEYDMDGNKLETAAEEKDLGVMVSDNLKCNKQCSEAVIKQIKYLAILQKLSVIRTLLSLHLITNRPITSCSRNFM